MKINRIVSATPAAPGNLNEFVSFIASLKLAGERLKYLSAFHFIFYFLNGTLLCIQGNAIEVIT